MEASLFRFTAAPLPPKKTGSSCLRLVVARKSCIRVHVYTYYERTCTVIDRNGRRPPALISLPTHMLTYVHEKYPNTNVSACSFLISCVYEKDGVRERKKKQKEVQGVKFK